MSTQSLRERNAVSLIAIGEKNQHPTSHHKTQLFSPELRNASALLFLLGFFLSFLMATTVRSHEQINPCWQSFFKACG